MKLIIAGSREIDDYDLVEQIILKNFDNDLSSISEFVSGACPDGVDKLGEQFAEKHGFKPKKFPANWKRYGKPAGFIRNGEMAEYADCLIAIWDGQSPGTANMIGHMNRLKKDKIVVKLQYVNNHWEELVEGANQWLG